MLQTDTSKPEINSAIYEIIRSEVLEPPARVTAVIDAIKLRHKDRIEAFVYYGSSLRELDNPEKMLDFYVLVDSYRKTHKNGLRALLNKLIPPAVYYLEHLGEDGTLSTCKYSILSLNAFEKNAVRQLFYRKFGAGFHNLASYLTPAQRRRRSEFLRRA